MGIVRYYGSQQEIDAISDIHRECYPDDTPDLAIRTAKRNPTWLLFDGGIQACLVSEISEDAPYIWSVSTRIAQRGKGYAGRLIKEFEKHFAGSSYKRMWLHCRVDNPAQKLYFDLGYRVCYFEPNIYAAGKHGIAMEKRIV